MKNFVRIEKNIQSYNKTINIPGDKSLSIRWVLLASQALGKSKAYNLLESEDVKSALKVIKMLGVSVKKKKNIYEINGKGLNSFNYKNNIFINAGNSGTLARLILGLLVRSEKQINLIGDKSLSKRDFTRVIEPLKKFGANIISKKKGLPLTFQGTNFLKPINYFESRSSAQCKSCVMLAALNTPGITKIKAKKSRNHTEILFKNLGIPIKIKSEKKFDYIEIQGLKKYPGFNYTIPGDISSSAFFIVLTLLSKKSKILIKNVNVNKSRTGIIDILKKMNAKIKLKNKKNYKGEEIADIFVKSTYNLKSIKCSAYLTSRTIDEFLILFLVAAKARGTSYFKNLNELNQKESPRLKIASKFLKMIGIKVIETNDSLKIFGNPNLKLNGNYQIKNYLKDHRVFAMSCIAALTFGGSWKIYDQDSIKTSFPDFLEKIKFLGGKIK